MLATTFDSDIDHHEDRTDIELKLKNIGSMKKDVEDDIEDVMMNNNNSDANNNVGIDDHVDTIKHDSIKNGNVTLKDDSKLTRHDDAKTGTTNGVYFGCFLWWSQFGTLLRKNFLLRLRTKWATILEITSPLFMMLILFAAYTVSSVSDYKGATYSSINATINGYYINMWAAQQTYNSSMQERALLSQTMTGEEDDIVNHLQDLKSMLIRTFQGAPWIKGNMDDSEAIFGSDHIAFDTYTDESITNSFEYDYFDNYNNHLRRDLQSSDDDSQSSDDDGTGGVSSTTLIDRYGGLSKFSSEIRQFLKGPMIIPTFGQYISLSRYITTKVIDVSQLPDIFTNSNFGWQWGNLLTLGTLHFSPSNNPRVYDFLAYLNKTYPDAVFGNATSISTNTTNKTRADTTTYPRLRIMIHDSEQDALDYIDQMHNIEQTWALLDFTLWPLNDDDNTISNETQQFKIRMNYTTIPNTAQILAIVTDHLDTDYQRYYLSGYLTLQKTINEYAFWKQDLITNEDTCMDAIGMGPNSTTGTNDVWSMPMPTPDFSQNTFYLAVGFLLGFTIVVSYLYPFSRLIKNIVEEKESKMKELLLISGVYESAHWLSWYIFSMIMFVFISFLVSVILSLNVLGNSDYLILFLWIGFFGTSCVAVCFLTSAFFSKSKLAAVIGPILLFTTILPRYLFFGFNQFEASNGKKIASLLPATAFAFGADIIADYEYAKVGVQPWNINEGDYSFQTSMGFLILDTILYTVLGWYFEQIMPRTYGKSKPWYFIVSPQYWMGLFGIVTKTKYDNGTGPMFAPNSTSVDDEQVGAGNGSKSLTERSYNEENVYDESTLPFVRIQNVSKSYNSKQPRAVDDLSFTFNQNQITALLGHNGAGKSSLLGILTGLISPTSGDCYIDGISIKNQTFHARQMIGFCPQENILFDQLTVYEHIKMFIRLRGMSASEESICTIASEVGLDTFLHVRSHALSGGNKRKLCLAMALSGNENQKLLIADEPTSGMDPSSRRACWACLRRKRVGRVVILVSHTMSEADLLADRVAIMKGGKIQASGSPLFLKDRFGLGYNLTVVVEDENRLDLAEERSTLATANALLLFVQQSMPEAKIVRHYGKEVTIRLPKGYEHTFPEALSSLETNRTSYGIGAFGVENSSLEEVFLLLAEDGVDVELESHRHVESTIEDVQNGNERSHFVPLSWLRQVWLMYWKRYIIQKRDPVGFFYAVIVPIIAIGFCLLILRVNLKIVGPAIELTPETLYTSTNLNFQEFDFLIGGGIAELDRDVISLDADLWNDFQKKSYTNVNSTYFKNLTSSTEMSNYLLESYNYKNHKTRLGAFVFGDYVNTSILVKWENLNAAMPILLNSTEAQQWLDAQTDKSLTDLVAMLYSTQSNLSSIDQSTANFVASAIKSGTIPLSSLLPYIPTNTTLYTMNTSSKVSIIHNASSDHSVAVFNQAYSDFLFRSCSGGKRLPTSINQPLPLTTDQSLEIKAILSVLTSMFLLMPFCLIPGAFVTFLVKERSCKSKHLQLVSGCHIAAYWIGSYLWDITVYTLLTLLTMCMFLAYGRNSAEVFVGDGVSLLCTTALIFGYGLSILPFSYIIARKFSNHSSAQIAVIGIVFFTGFVAVNAYFIMESIEKTMHVADSLAPLFRMWPAYNLGDGLIKMSNAFFARMVLGEDQQPFDWDVCGKPLALLYGLCLPYLIGLLLLEDGIPGSHLQQLRWFLGKQYERLLLRSHNIRFQEGKLIADETNVNSKFRMDDDVEKERFAVLQQVDNTVLLSPVVFKNMWKIYFPPSSRLINGIFRNNNRNSSKNAVYRQPKQAVRGLTVAVRRGETFVLLGPNGCGKSTSIGILSGDIAPTFGQVYVAERDVSGNDAKALHEARKHIGLCPQVDPILDLMTGRETLTFFARVRGIPLQLIDMEVNRLLDKLTLTPHADKSSGTYSGGNKRKLSLGIALIGNPSVLLIDESSSGVDPAAQRQIWNLISDVSRGRSVLLTTHSMDEAQALSTKTAIMAAGQLLCLGSVQHLKSVFLGGYTIDIYLRESSSGNDCKIVIDEVLQNIIPGSTLSEHHGRFIRFDVPDVSSLGLGETFFRLEQLKQNQEKWNVENYSIKQCSLEQVFVKLVDEGNLERTDNNLEKKTSLESERVEI